MPGIKLQSALEFLTTYSFMFIIIAIAIVLVVVLASSARTYVPPECQSFGGLTCESDVFTSNYVTGNSILVFTLSNAQSAPINISYIKATANGKTALGSCVSTFVIPGTNVTCIIKFVGFTLPLGSAISGSYTVNGFFCNSGIVNLTVNGCTYSPVIYIGSFNTQTIPSPIIFDFGGDEFQHNVTLVPNSDLYLCGVSTVDYPGLYAFSWSVDSMSGPFVLGNGTRTWQSSIGHQ
ncbi:MAG: hypothetical protein KGH72_05655, partial [Candidatus Micrarchaeota archaeon]|nr:hypothetical protein [Candidatus Micrarchaeota archaeon]